MEKYELMNQMAKPVDMILQGAFDLARATGVYDPFKIALRDMIKSNMLSNFVKNHDIEIIGEENIPDDGGAIVAANHQSWLDAQALGSSCKRDLHFMAKADFVDWPIMRQIIELSDSVFIRRGGDKEGLGDVVARLQEGWLVGIFPEGTIPGEEEVLRDQLEPATGLLKGKTGVVRMAIAAGVPIIPAGVSGTGAAFPPEMYPRFEMLPIEKPVKVTIKYGKPIRFEEKDLESVSREKLREYADKVMGGISKLVDHKRCFIPIEVPMKPRDTKGLEYYPKKSGKSEWGALVLHGFTSSLDCVSGIEPYLKARKIAYRFPVLRGHGTWPNDMVGTGFSDWYADAEDALLELSKHAENIMVMGLSMGGLVALDLGINHPELVKNVVLIAAALKFADPMSALTPVLAKIIKYWESPNSYNDPNLAEERNTNYPVFATEAFSSLLQASKDVEKRLGKFDRPVLILQSKKDGVVDPKAAKIIYGKIKSKEKKIAWFKESGHEMLLDLEADAALRTIDEYIAKVTE
jgi:carboxylesterase